MKLTLTVVILFSLMTFSLLGLGAYMILHQVHTEGSAGVFFLAALFGLATLVYADTHQY